MYYKLNLKLGWYLCEVDYFYENEYVAKIYVKKKKLRRAERGIPPREYFW